MSTPIRSSDKVGHAAPQASSSTVSTPAKPNRPTGQKRSLERGKSTRKKNSGKRATQGG